MDKGATMLSASYTETIHFMMKRLENNRHYLRILHI